MSCARFSLIALFIAACGPSHSEPRPRDRMPATGPEPEPRVAAVETEPTPRPEPEPEPPPEPVYDLEADLDARAELARRNLGKRTRTAVVEGVFLLVGEPTMSKSMFDRAVSLTRRASAAYFNDRFGKRPRRAVSVYLFGGRSTYDAFCRKHYGGCGTPYGVYYHGDRRIVMNARPGLGTLTHELVHPIVEADFPDAPAWINEGIASLFERPSIPRSGEIHGLKNWRYPRLARALKSKRDRGKANLRHLFAMSDDIFRGPDEDLGYAMARYLCQWLDERGMLWSFYQQWRDGYADDPTGARAFADVVGKDPGTANADWVRWLRRL